MHPEPTEEVRALRREHEQLHEIAFLGSVGSGRTVVAALLVDCLTTHWSDGTRAVSSVITQGEKRINDAIHDLMNCRYPAATKDGENTTVITIGDPSRSAEYSVMLHDMPSEDFVGKLTNNEGDMASMFDLIRNMGQEHLIFAKKYVIVVDCSRVDTWDTDSARLATALLRIMEVRRYVYETDKKIDVPVAVVITKTDTLPEEWAQQKSVVEILDKYQRLMSSMYVSYEADKVCFFKSHMDTVPYDGSDPPVDQRMLGSGDRLIKSPFQYNDAEYTGLVSWILSE